MSLITRMRKQDALYWGVNGVDGYGQPLYADPVEIKVRWEDKNEEFVGPDSVRRTSSAVVYVDRDMTPGDVLMLGTVDDLTTTDDRPVDLPGAKQIAGFNKIPNMKATEFLRVAYL